MVGEEAANTIADVLGGPRTGSATFDAGGLQFTHDDGGLFVRGSSKKAKINMGRITASNGALYGIDTVLIPAAAVSTATTATATATATTGGKSAAQHAAPLPAPVTTATTTSSGAAGADGGHRPSLRPASAAEVAACTRLEPPCDCPTPRRRGRERRQARVHVDRLRRLIRLAAPPRVAPCRPAPPHYRHAAGFLAVVFSARGCWGQCFVCVRARVYLRGLTKLHRATRRCLMASVPRAGSQCGTMPTSPPRPPPTPTTTRRPWQYASCMTGRL